MPGRYKMDDRAPCSKHARAQAVKHGDRRWYGSSKFCICACLGHAPLGIGNSTLEVPTRGESARPVCSHFSGSPPPLVQKALVICVAFASMAFKVKELPRNKTDTASHFSQAMASTFRWRCCLNARHGGNLILPALPIHHRRAFKLESVWANSPYITWTWNLFWHLREIPERKTTIWGDQPAVWSLYVAMLFVQCSPGSVMSFRVELMCSFAVQLVILKYPGMSDVSSPSTVVHCAWACIYNIVCANDFTTKPRPQVWNVVWCT